MLVVASNFLAWRNRIDIVLEVNEVIDHVHGKVSKPSEELALSEYMEKDLKAQKILKESIKDSLISYVGKLETSKEIYDKLEELFSRSTVEKILTFRFELHKLNIDEGISSCLSKASQINEQLKDLGDRVSDNKILSTILNVLTDEQGNLIASKEEEVIPYIRLWSLVKAEGDRMKNESEERLERRKQLVSKRKERFGELEKKRKNMAKLRYYGCHNFGHFKRNSPNLKRDREEDYSTKEVKEPETKKRKKEEAKRLSSSLKGLFYW